MTALVNHCALFSAGTGLKIDWLASGLICSSMIWLAACRISTLGGETGLVGLIFTLGAATGWTCRVLDLVLYLWVRVKVSSDDGSCMGLTLTLVWLLSRISGSWKACLTWCFKIWTKGMISSVKRFGWVSYNFSSFWNKFLICSCFVFGRKAMFSGKKSTVSLIRKERVRGM